MPRLTMPAAIIARARTPGSRKSTALSPAVSGMMFSAEKKISSRIGMSSVTSTRSPWRSVIESSILVWESSCLPNEAARGCSPDAVVVCVVAILISHLGSRQAQEEVFQRAMTNAQFRKHDLLIAQPGGQFRQEHWSGLGFHQIAAWANLLGAVRGWQVCQLRAVQASRGDKAHHVGILHANQRLQLASLAHGVQVKHTHRSAVG